MLAIGDKVTWTKVSRRKTVVSMANKEGVVIGFAPDGRLRVRPDGRGKVVIIDQDKCKFTGEGTGLSLLVEEITKNNRERME